MAMWLRRLSFGPSAFPPPTIERHVIWKSVCLQVVQSEVKEKSGSDYEDGCEHGGRESGTDANRYCVADLGLHYIIRSKWGICWLYGLLHHADAYLKVTFPAAGRGEGAGERLVDWEVPLVAERQNCSCRNAG